MTIAERYRIISKNKSKSISYNVLFVAIFVVFGFSFTLSRFFNAYDANFKIDVAKWQITINGETYDNSSSLKKEITLYNEDGTKTTTIQPGQKGYFDIVLNPNGTEVSIEYEIEIDMSQMPSSMQITGYTLNPSSSTDVIDSPTDRKIRGNILLNDSGALKDLDEKTYRIYWEWQSSNALTEANNYAMKANISVRQYLD